MCPHERIKVDARTLVHAIPSGPDICDGQTIDCDDHCKNDRVQGRHTNEYVNHSAKFLAREHPEIEEEEGELRAPDGNEPEYLGQPRELRTTY